MNLAATSAVVGRMGALAGGHCSPHCVFLRSKTQGETTLSGGSHKSVAQPLRERSQPTPLRPPPRSPARAMTRPRRSRRTPLKYHFFRAINVLDIRYLAKAFKSMKGGRRRLQGPMALYKQINHHILLFGATVYVGSIIRRTVLPTPSLSLQPPPLDGVSQLSQSHLCVCHLQRV